MVADRFNDRGDAAVAHAKTFAGHAANISLATRRAVERNIANNDILLGNKGGLFRWIDDDFAAGKAFADVIIGVALQEEGHAFRHKRAETLAGTAGEMNLDGILGQALGAPAAGYFRANDSADHAVDIADGQNG